MSEFGETMISGWTDEEIAEYEAYAAECDRFDDSVSEWPNLPTIAEIGEPPF